MPRYFAGDATRPVGEGVKIIAHVCNDVGAWGAGFVLALSKRWPEPEHDYRAWFSQRETNDFALGVARLVLVEPGVFVANVVGQHGLRRSGAKPPIRYDAVRAGLASVRESAINMNASVHMPRIGCGLAGGRWETIEPIVIEELETYGVDVTVYDF